MQLKQLELTGGGTLTVYLRQSTDRMPNAIDRPLVLVVPGGGYAVMFMSVPGRATR